MSSFRVMLGGSWKNYDKDEDKILKRAWMSGFPNAKYSLRGQKYEVDFKAMQQKNLESGKGRDIQPPHKWTRPKEPLAACGKTMTITVKPGTPGTTIHIPDPRNPKDKIAVNVPPTAKVGQAMLVPIPDGKPSALSEIKGEYKEPEFKDEKEKKKWSTGAKVAAAAVGVPVVGGLAVGGVLLGEHIAEEGWDATMADLGDVAADAGEAVTDAGEAAGEWLGDAADTAGDFIMDLF